MLILLLIFLDWSPSSCKYCILYMFLLQQCSLEARNAFSICTQCSLPMYKGCTYLQSSDGMAEQVHQYLTVDIPSSQTGS